MNRELLEQPFSPEQVKQRAGNFGQTLDYIEGHAVIQRLNDAFDGQWSFEVKSHEILESEVIVLGELRAENITKSQFGSSTVTKAKNSGEIISLADDLKAASTDCLKKCATMFGVALHLYSGNSSTAKPTTKPSYFPIENDPFEKQDDGINPPASPMSRQTHTGGNGNGTNGKGGNGGHGNNGNGTNGNGRLSSKQYNYILSLGNDNGLSKRDIDQKAIELFGCAAGYLSKGDASAFIQQMLTH